MQSRGLGSGDIPASIGPRYLITFTTALASFRIAEFHAAADYYDISYAFVALPYAAGPACNLESRRSPHSPQDSNQDDNACLSDRAYMLVHLQDDEAARKLAKRVTCIRSIWQHWASGTTTQEIKQILAEDESVRHLWLPWRDKKYTWKANVDGYMRSISMQERRDKVENFADVLAFPGAISLHGADFEWCLTEEWTTPRTLGEDERKDENIMHHFIPAVAHEGMLKAQYQRLIAVHTGRNITPAAGELAKDRIARMNVKKRAHIGNTTMESGMSLVQAGMALAGPGKLIYDPFVGTGSLLLAAAALGATTLGSDIDARAIRGKVDHGKIGIVRSAEQYGVQHHLLDSLCFDVTQHPFRSGELFDAIVTDPPYGVRAGAKRIGRKDVDKLRREPVLLSDGMWSHERSDYLPPKRPYILDDLLADLFAFAARFLVKKGRLVFWMPTMIEEEDDIDTSTGHNAKELHLPPTRDLRLIAHSLQDFGSWGRRLITMEKIDPVDRCAMMLQDLTLPAPPVSHQNESPAPHRRPNPESGRIRATDDPNDFRNKFFASRKAGRH